MTVRHGRQTVAGFWQKVRYAVGRAPEPSGKEQKNALFGSASQTYMVSPGQPVWTSREYTKFADEGYAKNVIAYRCVTLVAQAAASVPWLFSSEKVGTGKVHPLHALLEHPNPMQPGAAFIEALISQRLISGNAYIQAIGPDGGSPKELHLLRPDRVQVIAGRGGVPEGYRYTVGDRVRDFVADRLTGRSMILHWKAFHPLHDWYGLSPIEAAAYSIDQHNQSGAWNQALLQNGARPSGALVVKSEFGSALSEEQYHRLKQQVDEQFSGPANAGRPILLEGGLDWREMSLSPRDMDFINAKHAAARDIALAFGVPPQLLGIPGDNTYSNLQEARLALWEQTVIPLLDQLTDALNQWLVPMFGDGVHMRMDLDGVPALAPRREAVWARVKDAAFLSDKEKRALVGLAPV